VDTVTLSPGHSRICLYTDLLADGDRTNDTSCTTVFAYRMQQLPYWTYFNSPGDGWFAETETSSNWQWGTPAFGQTSGSYSSPTSWDIDLSTGYQDNTVCYLYSPAFDYTGAPSGGLSFWQNRSSEVYYDGMQLEYSTDLGESWSLLGTYHDGSALNWYNRDDLNFSGQPAWDSLSVGTGGTPGWQKSEYYNFRRRFTLKR
jgi:hypothetical protein